MNKKSLRFVSIVSALFVATSCSIFEKQNWNWDASTKNNTISYCLLIGQLDHNDSMERTRGVRDVLGTRDARIKNVNYNLEEPYSNPSLSIGGKNYVINEIEHMEQKAFSGATWDPITANGTTSTWICKHGSKITFFVSNNDGMAEGALRASNWYNDMPVFGYDANGSTIKLMKPTEEGKEYGKVIGTIDSVTYGQCMAAAILIRNVEEMRKKSDALGSNGKIKLTLDQFDPARPGIAEDFATYFSSHSSSTPPLDYISGKMRSSVVPYDSPTHDYHTSRAILLENRAVVWNKDIFPEVVEEATGKFRDHLVEANAFMDNDGNLLSRATVFNINEQLGSGGITFKNNNATFPERIKIWQCRYNSADVFFTGNMNPTFDAAFGNSEVYSSLNNFPLGNSMFNFGVKEAEGDGADEKPLLSALDSALSSEGSEGQHRAFLINVVKQPNSMEYIKKIAEKRGMDINKTDYTWEERDDTPIVFWNRQPTDEQGSVSDTVMNNPWFKYVYYVGFDAPQGGDLQGQLIKSWLSHQASTH